MKLNTHSPTQKEKLSNNSRAEREKVFRPVADYFKPVPGSDRHYQPFVLRDESDPGLKVDIWMPMHWADAYAHDLWGRFAD